MEPLHLDVKPGLPAFLKARARPVREALYKDAKAEFDRMKTYFINNAFHKCFDWFCRVLNYKINNSVSLEQILLNTLIALLVTKSVS